MVFVKKGLVKMGGTPIEISAELTVALSEFKKLLEKDTDKDFSEQMIKQICEMALMSDEEIDKKSEQSRMNLLMKILTDLREKESEDK